MIPFTQYLMPDGEKRLGGFNRPPEIESLAAKLSAVGAVFECEMLPTGHVSLTVERDDEDGEVEVMSIEVVNNGPEIPAAVDRLVIEAHKRLAVSSDSAREP